MIGSVAIKGDEIYFSEVIYKPNFGPSKYPLENWLTPFGIFIPFTTHSISAINAFKKGTPSDFVNIGDIPKVCGILITQSRVVSEVAVADNRIVLRSVPYGIGSIYTRSVYLAYEDALYAAIRLKDDFKEAIELARENCTGICSDPVFTTVSIVAYAAYKKDPGLIRTTTNSDMIKILNHEYERLDALNKSD